MDGDLNIIELTYHKYMKIIDTTTYFEENMMMELRFHILSPFVDKFIICESRYSHSGKEKDIRFNKKDKKFKEAKPLYKDLVEKYPTNFGAVLGYANTLSNLKDGSQSAKIDYTSLIEKKHKQHKPLSPDIKDELKDINDQAGMFEGDDI